MRVARLHGVADLRVETVPVPEPGPTEVLVRIEACGICPTDARKHAIGVNDGDYPFNPGHEWVGRIVAVADQVDGLSTGERVYGDTYAGYAEYAAIATRPGGLSRGALPLGDLPVERAIFVEPLADCLHAVHDQARVSEGQRVVVVGAGSMGLQMTAAAARTGARVLVVEPLAERRTLAERFGAELGVGAEGWREAALEWSGAGPDAIIVTIGRGEVAAGAVAACAPGGRVVLFAGFGDQGVVSIDLNRLHYQEISLVGSEWVGVPPHQRLERYEQARELLAGGELRLEELVSDEVGLDGVDSALRSVRAQRSLKTILYPGGRP
jgi:2-desacetyl-2-hydroxyethyl bacteriochlorophyllide A dehydrogenase